MSERYPISGNMTIGDGIPVSTGVRIRKSKGITITLEGTTFEDICAGVENLGKLPASAVSGPAKKAATKIKRLAKMFAPVRSGTLRKGIVVRRRKERTRTRGKAVYDIWMDPEMNDVFAKHSSAGKRYYYPGSMEYGFQTRLGKEPGRYFMKTAAEISEPVYQQLVLDEAKKAIDRAWDRKQAAAEQSSD